MNKSIPRRAFMLQSTAAAIASGAIVTSATNRMWAGPMSHLSPSLTTAATLKQTSSVGPLFEVSLAQWSLHRSIRSGKLTNLDFPRITKNEFGIDAVEYVNQFFKDKAEDEDYLQTLKQNCENEGVKSLLIMIDGEGQLGNPDTAARQQAVKNHHRWVEAAKFLGCHSIRVNAQSSGSFDEQAKLAADGLRQLCEFADSHDINVIVENHGGYSSNGQWLARVIRMVNLDNCGTLPDFGNFRISRDQEYDRYVGVASLMPFAKGVSAKSHDFDDVGNEINTDYLKMLQIVVDAGYRGYVGIEYEGGKLDEFEGIRKTNELLLRCREALSVG